MILLLKNCLIPWTLSWLMVCITGLGVNCADMDLTQQGKDALIAVNSADIAFLQNVNVKRLSTDNFTSESINQNPWRSSAFSQRISPSLPKPSGDYSVGTTSYYFTDPEREEIYTFIPDDNRELMVRVWYPSEKVSGGKRARYLNESLTGAIVFGWSTNSIVNAPVARTESNYPVLLFSHGFGSLPEFNTINAEELASEGYVVVSINHTYDSSVSVFPDGRVVTQSPVFKIVIEDQLEALRDSQAVMSSKALELLKQSVGVRAQDAQFVLNKLEDINSEDPLGLLTGKLDLDRVGILGHSLGGATAAQTLLQDERFKAGINLDGGLFINGVDKSLSQPFMFMNNEVFGTGNTLDPRLQDFVKLQQSFFQNLQSDGYEVTIRGTGHYYFSDLPLMLKELKDTGLPLDELENLIAADNSNNPNPMDPERAMQIINDYIVAFFNRYLKNQESPLLRASSPYPEVIALRTSQIF